MYIREQSEMLPTHLQSFYCVTSTNINSFFINHLVLFCDMLSLSHQKLVICEWRNTAYIP